MAQAAVDRSQATGTVSAPVDEAVRMHELLERIAAGDRTAVTRSQLLAIFERLGDSEQVGAARRRLASLLF